jgi:hypothetical protein
MPSRREENVPVCVRRISDANDLSEIQNQLQIATELQNATDAEAKLCAA